MFSYYDCPLITQLCEKVGLYMQALRKEVSIMPVQWHAVWLGLFASIIAPFEGFFSSGFKEPSKSRILVIVYLDMVGLLIGWTARW
ncbi:hypothetical protein Dimus_010598 [Dionaea muscipula]